MPALGRVHLNISGGKEAFSLIEVTLAIGVVSFSMLAIFAVLPVGLGTLRDAKVQTALGGIERMVRAEAVQQWTNFNNTDLYFTDEGVKVASTNDAYYMATASLTPPIGPGLTSTVANSLQTLRVTVVHPLMLPATSPARQTNEFCLLLARQKGEKAD